MANKRYSDLVNEFFPRFSQAAMWLGGSALLGSLALVLWNRRALKSMLEASKTAPEPVPALDDTDIY